MLSSWSARDLKTSWKEYSSMGVKQRWANLRAWWGVSGRLSRRGEGEGEGHLTSSWVSSSGVTSCRPSLDWT